MTTCATTTVSCNTSCDCDEIFVPIEAGEDIQAAFSLPANRGRTFVLKVGEHVFDNFALSNAAGYPVELTLSDNKLWFETGARLNTTSPVNAGLRLLTGAELMSGWRIRYVGPGYTSDRGVVFGTRPNPSWEAGDNNFYDWAEEFCLAAGYTASEANAAAGETEDHDFSDSNDGLTLGWWNRQFPTTLVSIGQTQASSRHAGVISFNADNVTIRGSASVVAADNFNNAWKLYGPSADDGDADTYASTNLANRVEQIVSARCDMGGQVSKQTGGTFWNALQTERTNRNPDAENHDLYATGNDSDGEFSHGCTYYLTGSYGEVGDNGPFGSLYKIRASRGFTVAALSGSNCLGLLDITEHSSGTLCDAAVNGVRIHYNGSHVETPNQGDRNVIAVGNDSVVTLGNLYINVIASTADETQDSIKALAVGRGAQVFGGHIFFECEGFATSDRLINVDGYGMEGRSAAVIDTHVSYNDLGGQVRPLALFKNGAQGSRIFVDKWNGLGSLATASGLACNNLIYVRMSAMPASFDPATAFDRSGSVGPCNEIVPTDVDTPFYPYSANVDLNAYARGGFYVPDGTTIAPGASTVTVGSKTYTGQLAAGFVAGGTNNYLIEPNASGSTNIDQTLQNIFYAITANGAQSGIKYGSGTTINANVGAYGEEFHLSIYALARGAAGNALTVATTIPEAVLDGATLAHGGEPDFTGAIGINMNAAGGARSITLPAYPWDKWYLNERKAEASANAVTILNAAGGTVSTMAASAIRWHKSTWFAYRIEFTSGGTYVMVPGNTVTGATSAATGVLTAVVVTSGNFPAGTAAGWLVLQQTTGTFVAENLNVGGNLNVATIASIPLGGWQANTVV